jgi:mannose/fructose-specific phosphotransferase system component IIA
VSSRQLVMVTHVKRDMLVALFHEQSDEFLEHRNRLDGFLFSSDIPGSSVYGIRRHTRPRTLLHPSMAEFGSSQHRS